MKLDDRTKQLLNETKQFIQVNDFQAAYDYYLEHCDNVDEISNCTLAFFRAKVNPMRHMIEVPSYYLCEIELPGLVVTLPKNVELIGEYAFAESSIGKLVIEGTITEIATNRNFAFDNFNGVIRCNKETQEAIIYAYKKSKDNTYLSDVRWEIV